MRSMGSLLARRGPDGAGVWSAGRIGLGHALLAATPEALLERLPLEDEASGCVITADVRLDNRAELLNALGLSDRARVTGDAGLILAAYLEWGTACVERFLGDFTFAIWDPREQRLFCARDHFGMRPFYYHHTVKRFFAFASEPRAILALTQAPYRLNEGRIAAFLVSELEGIDRTSTFFEEVYRLPPAHPLTVSPEGVRVQRYWSLEPGAELHLPSNEAYAEAFLEVFTEAVRCRLRGAGPVGSMLSGGMDSGSIVAVARQILAREGQGPLPTFSAIGPDASSCVETRTIQAALTMEGLDPCTVGYDQLDEFMPDLEELTWNLDEPFDGHMTLVRVVYLAARRFGINVLLDGVGGDTVLAEGTHLARLIRSGRWLSAYRGAVGLSRFWGPSTPAWTELGRSARSAILPDAARRLRRWLRQGHLVRSGAGDRLRRRMNPEFAHRVSLDDRLATLWNHVPECLSGSYGSERALAIEHPYLLVGRERYDRVASAVGIEPRDPFLDRRVVELCVSLPGDQKLGGGWPKAVLRRATAGRLPDAVRWRCGKEHLGWSFTTALMQRIRCSLRERIEVGWESLTPYLEVGLATSACRSYFELREEEFAQEVFDMAYLSAWLRGCAVRPKALG